jgi:maleylacetate reductase
MLQSGRVVFSQMEQVLFGIPAAQAVTELAGDCQRVFLMVSGTLNRQTDQIETVRRALGNRCVGTFDRMPPHTPQPPSSPPPSRPASWALISSSPSVAAR